MVTYASTPEKNNSEEKVSKFCHMVPLVMIRESVAVNLGIDVIQAEWSLDEKGQLQGAMKEYDFFCQSASKKLVPGQELVISDGKNTIVSYVKKETNWKDNKENGKRTEFNKDGTPRYVISMDMGVKHGEGTRYLPDGKEVYEKWEKGRLTSVALGKNGQLNGSKVSFLPNGQKVYERWENGKLIKNDSVLRVEWAKRKKTR